MAPDTLILAGGLYHPAEESGPALAEILAGIGWRGETVEDVEAGLARLAAGEFNRLVVACLAFTMRQHEKYAPHRQRFALSLSEAGRAAIRGYLATGRGLLAIHTAPICFDDWPEWPRLLGMGWNWGVSHHPPLAPLTARAVNGHPICRDLPDFAVSDEIYSALEAAPWMTPFLEARHADMAEWRPVGQAGEQGGSRRAWCGLGHDRASLMEPTHRRLIQRAAQWVWHERPTA